MRHTCRYDAEYDEDEEFSGDDDSEEAFLRGRVGTETAERARRAGGGANARTRGTPSGIDDYDDDADYDGGGDGDDMYGSQYDSDDDIYGDFGDDDDGFGGSDGYDYDDDSADGEYSVDDGFGGGHGKGFQSSRKGGRGRGAVAGGGGGRRGPPRGGRGGRKKPPPARMELLKARLFDAQTGLKTKMSSVSHKGAKVIRELKV